MPSNLNAADVLMYDWADRARRILDEYKRKNTPDLTPRGEITPLPPDPDEVAADFFFGKGTGSTAADILLGLTGPVAGLSRRWQAGSPACWTGCLAGAC